MARHRAHRFQHPCRAYPSRPDLFFHHRAPERNKPFILRTASDRNRALLHTRCRLDARTHWRDFAASSLKSSFTAASSCESFPA